MLDALTADQQARNDSPTAARLRAVLEDARRAQEMAAIIHAAQWNDETNSALVAAYAAADYALDALAYYVGYGAFRGGVKDAPDPSPLHERCRQARARVHAQVVAILAAGAGI